MNKWDKRFISILVNEITTWSKDPSTKVGAVLVDAERTKIVPGYNGFPRVDQDKALTYDDRDEKYNRVVHAEVNAILNSGGCKDHTLYVYPLFPCEKCAPIIAQAGIKRIVAPTVPKDSRWYNSYLISKRLLLEWGLEIEEYDRKEYEAAGCEKPKTTGRNSSRKSFSSWYARR